MGAVGRHCPRRCDDDTQQLHELTYGCGSLIPAAYSLETRGDRQLIHSCVVCGENTSPWEKGGAVQCLTSPHDQVEVADVSMKKLWIL